MPAGETLKCDFELDRERIQLLDNFLKVYDIEAEHLILR